MVNKVYNIFPKTLNEFLGINIVPNNISPLIVGVLRHRSAYELVMIGDNTPGTLYTAMVKKDGPEYFSAHTYHGDNVIRYSYDIVDYLRHRGTYEPVNGIFFFTIQGANTHKEYTRLINNAYKRLTEFGKEHGLRCYEYIDNFGRWKI